MEATHTAPPSLALLRLLHPAKYAVRPHLVLTFRSAPFLRDLCNCFILLHGLWGKVCVMRKRYLHLVHYGRPEVGTLKWAGETLSGSILRTDSFDKDIFRGLEAFRCVGLCLTDPMDLVPLRWDIESGTEQSKQSTTGAKTKESCTRIICCC